MNAVSSERPRTTVALVWDQFSPYHVDRCRRLAADLGETFRVVGVQVCSRSNLYGWSPQTVHDGFELVTLFPDRNVEDIRALICCAALWRFVIRERVRHLFLPGYHNAAHLATAAFARVLGRRSYLMLESKFEDRPRRVLVEAVKAILLWPYYGALVGGGLTLDYLRFLGFRRPVELGYDTVSRERLQAIAPAFTGDWRDRSFLVVARLVEKKNLAVLLRAFALYRSDAGAQARALRICGSGPLEAELRALAAELGVSSHVEFLGFQQEHAVAVELSRALCLLLPSVEEQWGLVVNEAVSVGLPIIVSDRVGARELLVRSWLNGFVLETDNIEGWAGAMILIGEDEALWRKFSNYSQKLSQFGDTRSFSQGAERLIHESY